MLTVLVSVCVLSCAALQTSPDQSTAKSSQQLYEQAAKAIASADPRAAIVPLEQLIEVQPKSSLACVAAVHLAECYIAVERAQDAAKLLEKWTERISQTSPTMALPNNLEAQHLRVWLQASKRITDDSSAIQSLEIFQSRLRQMNISSAAENEPIIPESNTIHDAHNEAQAAKLQAEARTELIRRLIASGNLETAATQISELIKLNSDPVSPDVQLLYAMVFQQVGDHDKSRNSLHALLTVEPPTPSHLIARLELATYAMQAREYETARETLRPIIDAEASERGFSPAQDCRFRLLWSELELVQGNPSRSLEVLPNPDALKLLDDSQVIAVRFGRAEAAANAGKNSLALEELQWLSDRAATNSDEPSWAVTVALRQCELLLKTKQYNRLIAAADEAKIRFGDFARLHEFDYLLARAAMLQVDFEKARGHLNLIAESTTAKNSSAAARAQWMLGETYFLEQNFTAALTAYKPVTEQDSFQTWQTLAFMQTAKCHELLNQTQAAIAAYQKVLANSKDEKIRQEAASRIEVVERIANSAKAQPLR